mgnify:CR=1 FL=1
MKIEINEWILNLPFFVSFFWIFIYKFEWRNFGLGKLNKKQKAIVKKETKKCFFTTLQELAPFLVSLGGILNYMTQCVRIGSSNASSRALQRQLNGRPIKELTQH